MRKGEIRPDLWKARIGSCLICSKTFRAIKDFKERKQKYCSKECWSIRVSYRNKKCKNCEGSLKMKSKDFCSRECAFEFRKAENHHAWKGENCSYSAVHKWINAYYKKSGKCKNCGNSKPRTEWANISLEYKRDILDYIELCSSCHRYFDRNDNFRKDIIRRFIKYANKPVYRIVNGDKIDVTSEFNQ